MRDPNLLLLENAARLLRPVLDERIRSKAGLTRRRRPSGELRD